MATEKQIVEEIVEKCGDFERGMVGFLSECAEWANLFKVKPPKRQSDTFSNPRQTEFFRAASAVAILQYRMMTSADPFFDIKSVDLDADFDKLDTLRHVWKTQLKYSKYRQNLLRACHLGPVFGTVICQEDYRVIGVSPFGRKIPTTVLIPRVLDQVMFDRATTNFDDAEWVATADITSSVELMRLAREAKDIKAPWNPKALEAASKAEEEKNTINPQVLERLRRAGFTDEEAFAKKKEIVMYYGKLDAMADGVEYVCAVINRKYLVRFHPNNFQHGRRPFRVSKWVDFDSALGYGLGSLLSGQHKMMDGNRQRTIDSSAMASYGMWKRRKNTVADEDLVIRPWQIIDVENPDDITPLQPELRGIDATLRLDEFLKQEFRAASGASDTLQLIANDGISATAQSLAQNESMRRMSVVSEIAADSLVREHLENLHWNNVQNIKAPFNINKAGVATRVYPSDLRIDLEIEAKCTTDKDFSPKRLEQLTTVLQTLISTKSSHPDQMAISILPLMKEIAYLLQVNPSDVIQRPGAMPMAPGMDAGSMLGLASTMTPGLGGAGGGMMPVQTPVGPTLAA